MVFGSVSIKVICGCTAMLAPTGFDTCHPGHDDMRVDRLPTGRRSAVAAHRLVMLCAAFLLTGVPASLAQDGAGGTQARPTERLALDTDTLLRRIEQQIGEGHILSPAEDSAMTTWRRVIGESFPMSAATRSALTDFVERAQSQAAAQKAARRGESASDFATFAWLAKDLLAKADRETTLPAAEPTDLASGAEFTPEPPPGSEILPALPPDAVSRPGSVAEVPLKGTRTPANPAAPSVLAANTATAAQPLPHPTAPPPESPASHKLASPDPSSAELFAARGDQMLALKDISAARRLYQYAANAGSARAAALLAKTFDPAFLTRLGVVGLRPDPAMAVIWYDKAAAMSDADAAARLNGLSAGAVK